MMKKLFAILCALMMLCGAACAEGVSTHHVPALSMRVVMPADFVMLTEDTDEALYTAYGMNKADIVDFMHANDTYAIILPADFSYEIDVSMALNSIETFNDVDDEMLISMIDMVGAQLETLGVVFDSGEYFNSGSDKYLRLYYHVPGDAYITYAVQYYTVQNNQAINFRLFTYGAEATAEQLAEVESIMRGVTFD